MELTDTSKIKKAEMSVVVTRADGTVENLGVVAQYAPEDVLQEDKETLKRRVLKLFRL